LIRIAAVVEGYGDVNAVPALIARTGELLGLPIIAPNPIRAGEWKSIRATGVFERYLELAYRRGWDRILVLLDLEDLCSATEGGDALARVTSWAADRHVIVHVVFFVREYESIFLACIDDIVGGDTPVVANPEAFRDAKGQLKKLTGRRYKETQDQEAYSKIIRLDILVKRSRSYRKLVKDLSGMSYEQIDAAF